MPCEEQLFKLSSGENGRLCGDATHDGSSERENELDDRYRTSEPGVEKPSIISQAEAVDSLSDLNNRENGVEESPRRSMGVLRSPGLKLSPSREWNKNSEAEIRRILHVALQSHMY